MPGPGIFVPPTGSERGPQTDDAGVTVQFQEMLPKTGGSPIITVDCQGGGTTVERAYLVDWKDVPLFIKQVGGYSYVTGTGTSAKLRRHLPMFDPVYTWLPAVKVGPARGINWTGDNRRLGGTDEAPQTILVYDKAVVPVTYGEVDYYITADASVDADTTNGELLRYVSFTRDSSVDYISIPTDSKTLFLWSEGPHHNSTTPSASGTVPDTPGRPLPGSSFHYRWRLVPYANVPFTAISNTLGRVNNATFLGCDPHTLLFIAQEEQLVKMPDGNWACDVIYSMRYLKTGWNRILDWLADPISFYQIAVGGITYTPGLTPPGKLIFDEAPYPALFKVET